MAGKRLVVCIDGTWNKVVRPEAVTNVVKLASSVKRKAADETPQIVYYNAGVGTGGLVDRFLGGVFGTGTRSIVQRAYAFLMLNYEPGDDLFVFGFSRGAYAARLLAGLVGSKGLLKAAYFDQFDTVWRAYRVPKSAANTAAVEATKPRGRGRRSLVQLRAENALHEKVPIKCVGVWDTVGSYGFPAGFGLGGLGTIATRWVPGFTSTALGTHIGFALHAVGIDEKRRPFAPTFWTIGKDKPPHTSHVEQVWMPGVHSNIGGGYEDSGLADAALIWMVSRVEDLTGLEFDFEAIVRQTQPDSGGNIYESRSRMWPLSRVFPYHRPVLSTSAHNIAVSWNGENPNERHIEEYVHWSVLERLKKGGKLVGRPGPYKPRYFPTETSGRVKLMTELEQKYWEARRR